MDTRLDVIAAQLRSNFNTTLRRRWRECFLFFLFFLLYVPIIYPSLGRIKTSNTFRDPGILMWMCAMESVNCCFFVRTYWSTFTVTGNTTKTAQRFDSLLNRRLLDFGERTVTLAVCVASSQHRNKVTCRLSTQSQNVLCTITNGIHGNKYSG